MKDENILLHAQKSEFASYYALDGTNFILNYQKRGNIDDHNNFP